MLCHPIQHRTNEQHPGPCSTSNLARQIKQQKQNAIMYFIPLRLRNKARCFPFVLIVWDCVVAAGSFASDEDVLFHQAAICWGLSNRYWVPQEANILGFVVRDVPHDKPSVGVQSARGPLTADAVTQILQAQTRSPTETAHNLFYNAQDQPYIHIL